MVLVTVAISVQAPFVPATPGARSTLKPSCSYGGAGFKLVAESDFLFATQIRFQILDDSGQIRIGVHVGRKLHGLVNSPRGLE